MNIFVDVAENKLKDFSIVDSFEATIELLKKHTINIISLNYQLKTEKTGYDIIKWINNHNKWPKTIVLHLDDPILVERMMQYILKYKPDNTKVINNLGNARNTLKHYML